MVCMASCAADGHEADSMAADCPLPPVSHGALARRSDDHMVGIYPMNAYRMTIWQTADGMDHAKWSDLEASSRHGATRVLARQIIALDYVEDLPVEAVGKDGRLRFTARSVFSLAGTTLAEGADQTLRVARHRPYAGVRG